MSIQEKAAEVFYSGSNCAQAVLEVFAERVNIDRKTAFRLTIGFGSGIARMQETCGAITGAAMVIGLAIGEEDGDQSGCKEKVYTLIREFVEKFKEKNGTIKCRELLQCDVNTEEGIYYYDVNELHEKVCTRCIMDAVEILDTLIS
jgi:C_GCAxxG_C_C family probable redox protein